MEIFEIIWNNNPPAMFATICLALYFFGMAVVFISKPLKNAESFSSLWITQAKPKYAFITAVFLLL